MVGRRTNDIDRCLGHRIKDLRLRRGMTQQQLAQRIGMAYQQLSKYENGTNRLAASRLFEIARALDVAVADLFDGYDMVGAPPDPAIDLVKSQMLRNLMKAFCAVEPKNHEALARVVRALGKSAD